VKPSEAKAALALLIAAYPRGQWPQSTQEVYALSLEPFTFLEARRAIERLIAMQEFPPAISEIRRAIIEDRLGLPGDVEAWELAVAHAAARRPGAPKRTCYACMKTGRLVGGDLCPDCEGTGELDELDLDRMPPVPDPIPAAVRFVGGWRRIRESDRPDLLRRDFVGAYRRLRLDAVERENFAALGGAPDHPLAVEARARAIEAA
jgi:hypothetical protein